MPRELQEKALKLWTRYATEGREYADIASTLGLSTAELNRRCWEANHIRRKKQSAKTKHV